MEHGIHFFGKKNPGLVQLHHPVFFHKDYSDSICDTWTFYNYTNEEFDQKKNNTLMTYANNCSLDPDNDYFERRFSLIFKGKTLAIPTWSKVVNTFDRIPNYILTNDALRRF